MTNAQNAPSQQPQPSTLITTPNQGSVSFAELGVSRQICEQLQRVGYSAPFQIQALTIPSGLRGADIIGQAKTGTGKTLGFLLPVLQHSLALNEQRPAHAHRPTSLVMLPTRELASQVADELKLLTPDGTITSCEVYGGTDIRRQIRQLDKGCEIVVGTPGRIRDLINRRELNLSEIDIVVLDEADEMLDMGFLPDVEKILSLTPPTRQTMLFSATMPSQIMALARRYMSKPTHIQAHSLLEESENATAKDIKHVIYRCHAMNKDEVLTRILQARGRELAIIFTHTKRTAQRLADDLLARGFAVGALHGDMPQKLRERSLNALRSGKIDVLVATDVAARGIDVDNVSHVINYQCPQDAKTFIHRTGRTGRAGQKGHAITFVDWEDVPRWRLINKEVGLEQPEPVETYHTSAHLYSDLDIPENAVNRLPRSQRNREGLEEVAEEQETGRRKAAGRGRACTVRSARDEAKPRRSRRRLATNSETPASEGGKTVRAKRQRTRKTSKIQEAAPTATRRRIRKTKSEDN